MSYIIAGLFIGWLFSLYCICRAAGSEDEAAALLADEEDGRRAA